MIGPRTPVFHIFGSDELSARAPPLATLIPAPYVALNPADADALGAAENTQLDITLPGEEVRLPLQRKPALARGTVGLPIGVPGTPWFAAGVAVTLAKAAPHD